MLTDDGLIRFLQNSEKRVQNLTNTAAGLKHVDFDEAVEELKKVVEGSEIYFYGTRAMQLGHRKSHLNIFFDFGEFKVCSKISWDRQKKMSHQSSVLFLNKRNFRKKSLKKFFKSKRIIWNFIFYFLSRKRLFFASISWACRKVDSKVRRILPCWNG